LNGYVTASVAVNHGTVSCEKMVRQVLAGETQRILVLVDRLDVGDHSGNQFFRVVGIMAQCSITLLVQEIFVR